MEDFRLKLDYKELRMIKEMIVNDMETSCYDAPEYEDIETMQYYLDRATVYKRVLGLLKGDDQ